VTAHLAGRTFLRAEEAGLPDDIGAVHLAILAAMGTFASEGEPPVCWASNKRIARRARCNEATVKRGLLRLARAGLIERESQRPGETIRWRLPFLAGSARTDGARCSDPGPC
jgi:hypothetical protein